MWHYHLEYGYQLRLLWDSFRIEVHGPGALAWRDVDKVVRPHWTQEGPEPLRGLVAATGNQWTLFLVPTFLAWVNALMWTVTVLCVVDWPVPDRDWPKALFLIGFWVPFGYGSWVAWRICKPLLFKTYPAAEPLSNGVKGSR